MPELDNILSDITVLDLSQGISGPYCTKILASLGARVIKIEPSSGDYARQLGPFHRDQPHPEKSGVFLYLNTGKESVTLNLDTPSGAALFKRLVPTAQVLVESSPPDTMAQWGLSYPQLTALRPDLIYCSVTPFGQTGPYRHYKGPEIVIQAISALLYPVGLPEREPMKIGGTPALMTGGISAFSAIMLALHHYDETGEGQHIDVSLLESTSVSQIHASVHAQFGNSDPMRRASILSRTKDGWMNVGIQDSSWVEFCHLIKRPELLKDERFIDMAARRRNSTALNEVLELWLADQEKVPVYHQLQAMRSIAGPVLDMADLFESEQYRVRDFWQTVDHPVTGPLEYPGALFHVGDVPWRQQRAPLLGEHTQQVLTEVLQSDADDLVQLREQGVI